MLSTGERASKNGYKLAAKDVAKIAGCKLSEVAKYRIETEFEHHSKPMYRNPLIIQSVRRAMADLRNSNVTLKSIKSKLICYDLNQVPST